MKKTVSTPLAPEAVGPYSQAVIHNGTMYCSGQVALDPKTGVMIQDDIETETHQVFANIKGLLSAEGLDLSDIIKCSVFLNDMSLFKRVNAVYATYFEGDFPARECVAVRELPIGANIEITVIAATRN